MKIISPCVKCGGLFIFFHSKQINVAKITYLLGAGASANTIPVVADMHERMKEVNRYLVTILRKYGNPEIYQEKLEFNSDLAQNSPTLRSLNTELEWLIKEAGNFYTIDTLAKKYYLTGDDDNLIRLKRCLIIYFSIEQYIAVPSTIKPEFENIIDKRYGSFIAAITRKLYLISEKPESRPAYNFQFELNPDISMLSWNYDMQFELSLKSILASNIKIHFIKKSFQILPHRDSKSEVNNIPTDTRLFTMVKLNGDAACDCITGQNLETIRSIFDGKKSIDDREQLLANFLIAYSTSNIAKHFDEERNSLPELSFNFAWESDPNYHSKYQGHTLNLEAADKIAAETEILVVIGYSFPVFNREIDNRLIGKMAKLTKVYIQDANPERIKSTMVNAFERFQETEQVSRYTGAKPIPGRETRINYDYEKVPKIKIQTEDNLNQFVIPYELNQ